LEGLDDVAAKVRWRAARALGSRDQSPQTGQYFVDLPGSYLADAERIVPNMARLLKDADDYVREAAVRSLGLMGPKAKDAISLVIGLLVNDPSVLVRSGAATTLGRIGSDS